MNEASNGINKEMKDEHMSSKRGDMEAVDMNSNQSESKRNDQQDFMFYHKKAIDFMKSLKRDYKRLALIYNACLIREQERERKNIEEILAMKKVYHQMQNEKIIVKRKKWCRYCESEATYLSADGNKFYCSEVCEQKQKEFTNAIEGSFKT